MANMPEAYHSPDENLYEIDDPYNVVAQAHTTPPTIESTPQPMPKNTEGKVDFSNMLDDIL